AFKAVGTTKSGLAGRVSNLNQRSLGRVTKEVKDLKKALDDASDKASSLNTNIKNVNSNSNLGGGGGKGKSKGKKSASGGMVTAMDAARYGTLPGYAPGVDTIPAVLSPGEAVLRPEVARSEEHTSELQSRENLVCRLLLEKKKK